MKNHKYNNDEYTPDDVQEDPVVAQIDADYWGGGDSNCDYLLDKCLVEYDIPRNIKLGVDKSVKKAYVKPEDEER